MHWVPELAAPLSGSGPKHRRQSQNVWELSVVLSSCSVGDDFQKELLLKDQCPV